jgi:hypothetical protein
MPLFWMMLGLLSGVLCIIYLWEHSPIVAVLSAPFVASAIVLGAMIVFGVASSFRAALAQWVEVARRRTHVAGRDD